MFSQSVNCSVAFCNLEKENIEHVFWGCHVSQQFWKEIENMFNSKCEIVHGLNITEDLILFGAKRNTRTDNICDFIILFAKDYLYSCKLKKCTLNINVFKKTLLSRYKIEKHIAKIKMNYLQFSTRWCFYEPMFTDC